MKNFDENLTAKNAKKPRRSKKRVKKINGFYGVYLKKMTSSAITVDSLAPAI
jgi:hypothetical protein